MIQYYRNVNGLQETAEGGGFRVLVVQSPIAGAATPENIREMECQTDNHLQVYGRCTAHSLT
jgi:hypothetical protein